MASFCTRSLIASSSRIALPLLTPVNPSIPARAFSNTALLSAAATKKTVKKAVPVKRQGGSFNKAKGGKVGGGGGGRKKGEGVSITVTSSELLKIIPDLKTSSVGVREFVPDEIEDQQAQATYFSTKVFENLQAFGLPKKLAQELSYGTPTSVIRDITAQLLLKLESARTQPSSETRILLAGSRGCGKSMLLVQAVAAAMLDDWVVIYVPRAIDYINSSSPYAYSSQTGTFQQPALSSSLLSSISTVNSSILSKLTLEEKVVLKSGQSFEQGSKVSDLVQAGAREEAVAVEVLEKVMDVLAKQTSHGVLLAIDDVQALFMTSEYRAPDYNLLQSYALSGPRVFLDYISGRKNFNKGAIVTSLSMSSSHHMPPRELYASFPNSLTPATPISAYEKLDSHHMDHIKGLQVVNVKEQLDLTEALRMADVWNQKRMIPYLTDEFLLSKFAESGGNAREFSKSMLTSVAL